MFKSPVTFMRLYLDGEGICLKLEPMKEQFKSSCFDEKSFEDINYYTSLFRCSVDYLKIDEDYLPEDNIDFGFNKLKRLSICGTKEVSNDKLRYLFEHFEVADTLTIDIPISSTFNCDPKLLKTEDISFPGGKSADWITGEFLSQLGNTQRFTFDFPQFTIKDVVSVIADWFLGRKPSLKSMIIVFKLPVHHGDLENEYFKPMPFDPERRPVGLVDSAGGLVDFSDGLDIVRSDGELATIVVEGHEFLFHVWSEDERRGLPSWIFD
ncbi:hypothetical protein CAEBREN_17266 [Caenorhabditis brenneri]|uniref:F-box associated domain-containing protein n=1 Tax=Caenorhabditis brenneri TaxID=135651 RepID=G0NHI0_CAEBE|nr:hypothetical protein CAEBREN_17266 [Caenorhabditis brenneri]